MIENFPKSDDFDYHLRFETVVNLAKKSTKVWADIPTHADISVPNVDGKIRIKALRIPKGL